MLETDLLSLYLNNKAVRARTTDLIETCISYTCNAIKIIHMELYLIVYCYSHFFGINSKLSIVLRI
jgi:hypothetical protein